MNDSKPSKSGNSSSTQGRERGIIRSLQGWHREPVSIVKIRKSIVGLTPEQLALLALT